MTKYERYCEEIHNIRIELNDRSVALSICAFYGWPVDRKGYVRCPFHDDRHPSMILTKHGYFKCFVCGEEWSPVDVVMKIEGIGLTDAEKRIWTDILGNSWPKMSASDSGGGDDAFVLTYDELRFIGLAHAMPSYVSEPAGYVASDGDAVPSGCEIGSRDADGGYVVTKKERTYGLRDLYDEDPSGWLKILLDHAEEKKDAAYERYRLIKSAPFVEDGLMTPEEYGKEKKDAGGDIEKSKSVCRKLRVALAGIEKS